MQRLATICEARSLYAELQRIEMGVPLSNTHADCFAGMPDRVSWESATLVCAIRHEPGPLSGDPDVECGPEAEFARHLGDLIRTDRKRALVEVDVAGGGDRGVKVLSPVGFVAMPGPSAVEPDLVANVNGLGVVAVFEGRQSHHGLEGGPGWEVRS